ncbi:MAG: class I SAM-dependent methyltransferase [Rhodospirillaceae bacterium]|jgi:SAM-dependent methyltransferase|nr:class I SAM-dependent methyltransferase [Rhodospirillaceae bacterium]
MWSDAIDLRDFYRTSLGQMARRVIRRRLREIWPNTADMTVLGLGYASPYLLPFRDNCQRLISTMPAGLGVLHWPTDGPNLVALADEAELPFADNSFDRVLLAHSIESAEQLRPMLREIWRVMQDGGRLLVVVPNRRGIWARLDRTPFGHGRPYTLSQITRLMRDNMFTPVGTSYGLFMPPSRRRMLVSSAPAWEQIGRRWFPHFGGVIFIEASKQIYAATPETVRKTRRRRAYMPVPGATEFKSEDSLD